MEFLRWFRDRGAGLGRSAASSVIVGTVLMGCAATPPSERTLDFRRIAVDVGLAEAPAASTFEGFYTWTPVDGPTVAFRAIYVGLGPGAMIARHQPKEGCDRVLAAFDISALQRVRLHRYLLRRQIQFETTEGVHAMQFIVDNGIRGWGEATEREYARWIALGVPHGESEVFFQRNVGRVPNRCWNP